MRNKDKCFLKTNKATKVMVLKNKHEFVNLFRTLHRKITYGKTATYVPVCKNVDTILHDHRNIGDTQDRPCKSLQVTSLLGNYNLTSMIFSANAKKARICRGLSHQSFITMTVKEPFSSWATDVVK